MPLPESNHETFFAVLGDGHFLAVRWCFYRMLPDTLAPYYAFLVNKRHLRNEEALEHKGWFRCSSEEMQRLFNISHKVQSQRLAKLKELGLLEMEERGIPRKGRCRWIRLDASRGYDMLKKADPKRAQMIYPMAYPNGDDNGIPIRVSPDGDDKVENNTKRTIENGVLANASSQNGLGLSGENGDHNTANPDYVLASRYQKELRSVGFPASWKPSIQMREFITLRKEVGESRLTAVIEWYFQNLKQRRKLKLPTATSPAQFRKRWDWIEDRYQVLQEAAAPQVEVSEEARRISKGLHDLRSWSPAAIRELPQYVQKGLEVYRAYMRSLVALYKRLEIAADIKGARGPVKFQASAVRRCHETMPSAAEYIDGWFRDWAEWENWNGDLQVAAFRTDHKRFRRHGLSWSENWDLIQKLLADGHQE